MTPVPATCGGEIRIDLLAGRDEVTDQADPAPIVLFDPVPQDPSASPTREVGQQRRLGVASLSRDEDYPRVGLGAQPVEQAVAREGFDAQRRTLNLRRLERNLRHALPRLAMRGRTRRWSSRTDYTGIRPPKGGWAAR